MLITLAKKAAVTSCRANYRQHANGPIITAAAEPIFGAHSPAHA
jgi:hypothetical protein